MNEMDESRFPREDDGTLARCDALRILSRWMDTEEFPDRMFGAVPPFRRGFVMDLVYATVRNVRALAFAIDRLVARRPERTADHAALLLGAAQMLKMRDVAEYAAVSATVDAYKLAAGPRGAGFINGVLRNLLRNRPAIEAALAAAPLAVRESHTDEQVARWERNFGAERAAAMCRWDNEPAGVTILTLPGRATVSELIGRFAEAGVEARAHEGFPDRAVRIPHGSRVDRLPGFETGEFSIQDPATLAAVELLDVRPGMRVLDACAAPGGKSVQIAALLAGRGELVAADCWRDRIDTLRENLARTGFDRIARVRVCDARRAAARDLGGKPFDRILADVPCSNTGVQRRRADARWRFDGERLRILNETQFAILSNLSGLLAPGGRLVYSTCSVEPEENDGIIERFLRARPDMRLAARAAHVPPEDGCDGAFAAALERIA